MQKRLDGSRVNFKIDVLSVVTTQEIVGHRETDINVTDSDDQPYPNLGWVADAHDVAVLYFMDYVEEEMVEVKMVDILVAVRNFLVEKMDLTCTLVLEESQDQGVHVVVTEILVETTKDIYYLEILEVSKLKA